MLDSYNPARIWSKKSIERSSVELLLFKRATTSTAQLRRGSRGSLLRGRARIYESPYSHRVSVKLKCSNIFYTELQRQQTNLSVLEYQQFYILVTLRNNWALARPPPLSPHDIRPSSITPPLPLTTRPPPSPPRRLSPLPSPPLPSPSCYPHLWSGYFDCRGSRRSRSAWRRPCTPAPSP